MQVWSYYRRNLERYIENHRGIVMLLGALFVIGLVFGALAVRSLDPRDRSELVHYLSGTIPSLQNLPPGGGGVLLKAALLRNLKIMATLWVLGISLVGIFGVMVVALLRGLVTGFVVAFLAAELGLRGVLLAAVGHLPQSLIEVPALILGGAASVAFSLQVVRSWRERRRVPNFYPTLAAFSGRLLVMGLALLAASLVESYLSPSLVRLVASFLHGA